MPAVSSADPSTSLRAGRAFDVPSSIRAGMIGLGFVPVIHLAAVVAMFVLGIVRDSGWLAAVAVALLYVLPPLLVRVVTWFWPLPTGEVDIASSAFQRWWFTTQCQMIFSRLPWLEELLRMVPSIYSAWLRLWGARVGGLVYWSPGVSILDRSLVDIGDRVIFGAGARLTPHVLAPIAGKRVVLVLAPVTIGSDALVGAYSTLLPGSIVAPGEVTAPFRSVHPAEERRSRLRTVSQTGSADAISQ